MDHTEMLKPITKWAKCVHETKRIPEFISMGFRAAMTGRQGPAFLEIPTDVLFMKVEESEVFFPESYRPTGRVYPDPKVVGEGGGGAAQGGAAGDHGRLARSTGARRTRSCGVRGDAAGAGVPERDGPRLDAPGPRAVLQPQPRGRR